MEASGGGPLPADRHRAPEAAHPAPGSRRPPLLRGADGGGGLLLRLLAALPPRGAVGDRRLGGVGAARPVADAQPSAETAPPEAARPHHRSLPGRRPPDGARQQRRAHRLRRHRHRAVAPLPQRDRRRVRLRRGRQRHGRDRLRHADLPDRRLRDRAASHHPPVGAGRAEPALPDRGEQPHRAAEALPLEVRAAARARAVLRARSVRTHRRSTRRRAPMSTCWSSTAPLPGSSAPG